MTLPSTPARSTASSAIPRPRGPQPDTTQAPVRPTQPEQTQPIVPEPRVGAFPWPEPWHYSRGARPRSEFWDVETASWHSAGLYPDRSAHS